MDGVYPLLPTPPCTAEELTQLLHHMARWGCSPNKHVVVLAQLTHTSVFVNTLQVAADYGIQVWFAVFPAGGGAGSSASAVEVASSLQEWAMEAIAVQGTHWWLIDICTGHTLSGIACMDHVCMQLVRALATTTVPATLSLGHGHSSLACELVPTLLPLRSTPATPPAMVELRAVLRVEVGWQLRCQMHAHECTTTDNSAVRAHAAWHGNAARA